MFAFLNTSNTTGTIPIQVTMHFLGILFLLNEQYHTQKLFISYIFSHLAQCVVWKRGRACRGDPGIIGE